MNISKYIIPAALIFTLAACEDDKTPVLQFNSPAAFNELSSSEITLNKENYSKDFPQINWTKADYNGAAVSYKLTLKNNATGKTVDLGETLESSFDIKNNEINSLFAQTGANPGIPTEYTISLTSTASEEYRTDEASNTITFKATAYDPQTEGINWNFAYVAVNYPDWNFEKSYLIGDPDEDGTFEGFVKLPKDAVNFAILDGKDLTKVISEGNAIQEAQAGFTKINFDGSETTVADTTIWTIIGSATSGGWDKETKMEYDETTRKWSVITPLVEGELKFRANDNWDAGDFGWTDDKDETLAPGGKNIKIEKSHAYIVTLDITHAGKYTYALEETEIVLSSEYVTLPGSFNDWDKETKEYRVVSKARDFVFSSTIYIPKDDIEFKFFDPEKDAWLGIKGEIDEKGNFAIGEGDNIKLEKAGYYNFNVDLKKMTASVTATGWELIGSAMEFGWDKGIVMDYDAETKTWSKTVTVKAGDFKFRWAGSWDINFGGELTGLTQGGKDIPISAGTYKIVLDPENATASVTKQ